MDSPQPGQITEVLRAWAAGEPAAFDRLFVEMRFFGGLSIAETALALGISPATVKRDWAVAKTWILRRLRRHS